MSNNPHLGKEGSGSDQTVRSVSRLASRCVSAAVRVLLALALVLLFAFILSEGGFLSVVATIIAAAVVGGISSGRRGQWTQMVDSATKMATVLTLVASAVLPISYSISGRYGFTVTVGGCAAAWGFILMGAPRAAALFFGLAYGVTGSVLVAPAVLHANDLANQWSNNPAALLLLTFAASLAGAAGIGLSISLYGSLLNAESTSTESYRQWLRRVCRFARWFVVIGVAGAVVFVALSVALPMMGAPATATGIPGELSAAVMDAAKLALAPGLGWATGWVLGHLGGRSFGTRMRPALLVSIDAWPYLKAMLWAATGFAVTYTAVVVWFAGVFSSIHRVEPAGAFINAPEGASFWEFLYFSLMTISSLGYGDMKPASALARAAAGAEALAGIGLTLVLFAALLAYLVPQFNKISRTQAIVRKAKKEKGESKGHS